LYHSVTFGIWRECDLVIFIFVIYEWVGMGMLAA